MSRALSLGRMSFEQANIALEDLLLAELDGNTGSIDSILTALDSSRAHLMGMIQHAILLEEEMARQGYSDLPTLSTTNLAMLGHTLSNAGIINNKVSWQSVQGEMEHGGFKAVLAMLKRDTHDIKRETELLRCAIAGCAPAASSGEVAMILEENRSGNFRTDFAKLYSSWNAFMDRFLASSILSTELWYRFNRYGSLIQEHINAASAA